MRVIASFGPAPITDFRLFPQPSTLRPGTLRFGEDVGHPYLRELAMISRRMPQEMLMQRLFVLPGEEEKSLIMSQAIFSSTACWNHAGIRSVLSSSVFPSVISANQVCIPSALFVELSKI